MRCEPRAEKLRLCKYSSRDTCDGPHRFIGSTATLAPTAASGGRFLLLRNLPMPLVHATWQRRSRREDSLPLPRMALQRNRRGNADLFKQMLCRGSLGLIRTTRRVDLQGLAVLPGRRCEYVFLQESGVAFPSRLGPAGKRGEKGAWRSWNG